MIKKIVNKLRLVKHVSIGPEELIISILAGVFVGKMLFNIQEFSLLGIGILILCGYIGYILIPRIVKLFVILMKLEKNLSKKNG